MPTSSQEPLFQDRREAGQALAEHLRYYEDSRAMWVLGLPRGGVPVAAEVAATLHAPLDVWLVRKLGVPGHEELAMGAIASGGIVDLDHYLVRELGIAASSVERVIRKETVELERRERAYRGERAVADVKGKTVLLVDDGLATGSSMRAAVRALRILAPARIVAAAPVASQQAALELRHVADECVWAATPRPFRAVGAWYADFSPTTDEDVTACLARCGGSGGSNGRGPAQQESSGGVASR